MRRREITELRERIGVLEDELEDLKEEFWNLEADLRAKLNNKEMEEKVEYIYQTLYEKGVLKR